MKKLMALGLLATTLAFADAGDAPLNEVASMMQASSAMAQNETEAVKATYGYVNLGLGPFPIPLPIFGVGGRFQNGHHGFDGSLQFISFGSGFTLLKENFDYLYFFKPNLASQFYVGGGASVTEVISRGRVQAYLSPQVVLGKQYTNKAGDVRYFQVQIDPVFLDLNHAYQHRHTCVGTFPCVIFSYGICF
jgi:hypothetical protein